MLIHHFRRYARELSMRVIFNYEMHNKLDNFENSYEDFSILLEDIIDLCNLKLKFENKNRIFRESFKIVNGVVNNIDKIDLLINKFSTNWSFDRIDLISKSVIRIAVYEILYCSNIPTKVSISESIEICKKYCISGDSYIFVNGILDNIANQKNS